MHREDRIIYKNQQQRQYYSITMNSIEQHRFKNKGKLRTVSIRLFIMQQNKRKYKENKAKGR